MISFNSEYNSTFLVVTVVWIILTLEKGLNGIYSNGRRELQRYSTSQIEENQIKSKVISRVQLFLKGVTGIPMRLGKSKRVKV